MRSGSRHGTALAADSPALPTRPAARRMHLAYPTDPTMVARQPLDSRPGYLPHLAHHHHFG